MATDINILLLGETGVGKSTFINSFANYIKFPTLEAARRAELMCLIPAKFTIVGDDYVEHIVKFGDDDGNEDHITGNSSTQEAKGHVFVVPGVASKVRIIDTPGVGDSRGVEQDEKNIRKTVAYLKNFAHLNAVCFVLKPTQTILNEYFKFCVTHLFSCVEKTAGANIVFAFTNSRSTFYRPGETMVLLQRLLREIAESPPHVQVPFSKSNIFCVDNEAFRYLMAMRDGHEFTENEVDDFAESWRVSASTYGYMLQYIAALKLHPIVAEVSPVEVRDRLRPLLKGLINIYVTMLTQQDFLNSYQASLPKKPERKDLALPQLDHILELFDAPINVCTSSQCNSTRYLTASHKTLPPYGTSDENQAWFIKEMDQLIGEYKDELARLQVAMATFDLFMKGFFVSGGSYEILGHLDYLCKCHSTGSKLFQYIHQLKDHHLIRIQDATVKTDLDVKVAVDELYQMKHIGNLLSRIERGDWEVSSTSNNYPDATATKPSRVTNVPASEEEANATIARNSEVNEPCSEQVAPTFHAAPEMPKILTDAYLRNKEGGERRLKSMTGKEDTYIKETTREETKCIEETIGEEDMYLEENDNADLSIGDANIENPKYLDANKKETDEVKPEKGYDEDTKFKDKRNEGIGNSGGRQYKLSDVENNKKSDIELDVKNLEAQNVIKLKKERGTNLVADVLNVEEAKKEIELKKKTDYSNELQKELNMMTETPQVHKVVEKIANRKDDTNAVENTKQKKYINQSAKKMKMNTKLTPKDDKHKTTKPVNSEQLHGSSKGTPARRSSLMKEKKEKKPVEHETIKMKERKTGEHSQHKVDEKRRNKQLIICIII